MSNIPFTVIENATVLTQDPQHPIASNLVMAGGKIIAVDAAVDQFPIASRIDAHKLTVVPGFNDVHAHSVWFGQTLMEVDLSSVKAASEVYDLIAKEAPNTPAGKWIVASGFVPGDLGADELELEGLDRAAQGHPLLIKHNSGHAYTVNSQALVEAGLDPLAPPVMEGGEFVVDEQGRFTGLVHENAMRYIQKVTLPLSQERIGQALDLATKRYVSEGITSITDAGIMGGWISHSPIELGAYQKANLHTRMQVMVTLDALHEIAGHADDGVGVGLDGGIRTGLGDEWLQIGPTKIFTDGSLLGKTAAMRENYECCHHHGYFQGDKDELKAKALAAAASGWSLAMHAIGDAAIDFAIEVITEATKRYGSPATPHRIEHGGVTLDEQLRKLSGLNVAIASQPYFIPAFGDQMAAKLGAKRTALSYPGKRILDAGLILPGSSDRPVAEGHPLKGMQAFAQRLTATGHVYGEADRISVAEALYAYTAGSAAATGWQGRKGQIIPGQLADVAVLAANPLEVPVEEVGDIEVVSTFVGGERRFGLL